ncbi:hypothetical protein [Azospirillum canadense]|uniref:hypothetical protein n=1 Tax=Azospirillum canadense TaxID=403962 RepID=UPI0022280996|nr:hypothetical protein [Azospirillum canadense]MCW2242792.1 hypothetical protein [Azospirillum canadense]
MSDDDMSDDDHFIAMIWYRREDWPEIKRRFPDSAKLGDSYDEWLRRSEAVAIGTEAKGCTVFKVFIRPNEFAVWCAERYLDMDAEARTAFASETLLRALLRLQK